jgi:monoamine oxidase
LAAALPGLLPPIDCKPAGASPVVFEASNRWGGRMYTQYDLYKGAFCELGDEFVYTDHEDLQNLGKELGVENAEPHHRRR